MHDKNENAPKKNINAYLPAQGEGERVVGGKKAARSARDQLRIYGRNIQALKMRVRSGLQSRGAKRRKHMGVYTIQLGWLGLGKYFRDIEFGND